MPKSFCEVICDGQVVGFTPYFHSSDHSGAKIYPTRADAMNLEPNIDGKCTCGTKPVDVMLVAWYGHDFHWPAKACLACGAIVDGSDPYCEAIDTYGWPMEQTPEVIASQKKHEAWHATGWPKSGHPLGHFQHELAEATECPT